MWLSFAFIALAHYGAPRVFSYRTYLITPRVLIDTVNTVNTSQLRLSISRGYHILVSRVSCMQIIVRECDELFYIYMEITGEDHELILKL